MSDSAARRYRRKVRVRAKISDGTTNRPRISVYRSTTALYAQVVDDSTQATLFGLDTRIIKKGTKTEKAQELGKQLAQKLQSAHVSSVVFDRNGFLYHGRVKAFCEALREAGITV